VLVGADAGSGDLAVVARGLEHAFDGGGHAGRVAAYGGDEGLAHLGAVEGDGLLGEPALDERAGLAPVKALSVMLVRRRHKRGIVLGLGRSNRTS
jgi:hypothetical protein